MLLLVKMHFDDKNPFQIACYVFLGFELTREAYSVDFCLLDGAECNAPTTRPGQSVAARLLVVIEDLEQAHATFQLREIEDATRVILNP